MILFKEKKDCCGCSACMSACVSKAIIMERDEQGFFYPRIDTEKCLNCGKCKSVCPIHSPKIWDDSFEPLAFAVKNKDAKIRMCSSSGGGFYELSKYVLKCGGIVYGAVFDKDFQIVHRRGTSLRDVHMMQGSKYVQSNTNGIYESVKNDLSLGKKVLFTGCPCQIHGLKQYLGKDMQERLNTCDLICRGVNSPRVWEDYLSHISKKEKILKVYFRDKSLGWRNPNMKICMSKKKYLKSSGYDYFYQAFYSYRILRKSCYFCRYADQHRIGDITIGDFWGIEHVHPEMDDNKGVSLVMINTRKGYEFFSKVKDTFIVKAVKMEQCMQPALKEPVKYPEQYEKFWKEYFTQGFPFICKRYFNGGIKGKLKTVIKKVFFRPLKMLKGAKR